MSVCCERCALSSRSLCDELITRRDESYRRWRVVVCDLEISCIRRPWPIGSCRAKNKHTFQSLFLFFVLISSLNGLAACSCHCTVFFRSSSFKIRLCTPDCICTFIYANDMFAFNLLVLLLIFLLLFLLLLVFSFLLLFLLFLLVFLDSLDFCSLRVNRIFSSSVSPNYFTHISVFCVYYQY